MDIHSLTAFFMWCTIINGSMLLLWAGALLAAPDRLYRIQNRWFPLPRETFDTIVYSFLGLFKLMFLVFNVTPYLALLIIA